MDQDKSVRSGVPTRKVPGHKSSETASQPAPSLGFHSFHHSPPLYFFLPPPSPHRETSRWPRSTRCAACCTIRTNSETVRLLHPITPSAPRHRTKLRGTTNPTSHSPSYNVPHPGSAASCIICPRHSSTRPFTLIFTLMPHSFVDALVRHAPYFARFRPAFSSLSPPHSPPLSLQGSNQRYQAWT